MPGPQSTMLPLFSHRAWCLCNSNPEIFPLCESNTFKYTFLLETQYITQMLHDLEVFLVSELWFQEQDGQSPRDTRVWELPIN